MSLYDVERWQIDKIRMEETIKQNRIIQILWDVIRGTPAYDEAMRRIKHERL
jgi:hypothetical protein